MNVLNTIADLATPRGGGFWFPDPASRGAEHIDWLFYYVLYICCFFFFLIVGLMLYMVVRYHQRPGVAPEPSPDHSRALEVTWTFIPLVLVVTMFYMGFTAYLDMRTPPQNSLSIRVIGMKWDWSFEYSNGYVSARVDAEHPPELHVPPDEPVQLVVTSDDVIHGLFIPAFRAKMDAVPGRYSKLYFNATRPGEYDIYCSVYCGTKHSEMRALCIVHKNRAEFQEWLSKAQEQASKTLSPVDRGRRLYAGKGCIQCHSLDGRTLIGPTFKDLFGKQEALATGPTFEVEENYLRESILEPGVKIVRGFENSMPAYKGRLSDRQITDLIDFIKTLSVHYKPEPEVKQPEQRPEGAAPVKPEAPAAPEGQTQSAQPKKEDSAHGR